MEREMPLLTAGLRRVLQRPIETLDANKTIAALVVVEGEIKKMSVYERSFVVSKLTNFPAYCTFRPNEISPCTP